MTSPLPHQPYFENYFKKKIAHPVGIGVLAVMLLLILTVVGYRVWLRTQINAAIADVRAAHLPVTLAEANDWYTAVPAPENAAVYFVDHFFITKPGTNETRIPIVGSGILPKASEPLAANTKAAIEKYVAKNSNALQVLHAALQLKKSRYPIDLELGAGTLLPHLSRIHEAADLLQLNAILALENGDHAKSVASALDLLRLADTLRNEPVMISQIVRLRTINQAIESVSRIISIPPVAADELASLSFALVKTDDALKNCWERLVVDERSMGFDIFKMPTHKVVAELMYFAPDSPAYEVVLPGPLYETLLAGRRLVGFWDADCLFFLKTLSRVESLSTRSFPEATREAAAINASVTRSSSTHSISRLLLPDFESALKKLTGADAVLKACRIALAIESYRERNGRAPDDLQSLVPEYLKSLPADPASGRPFHYSRTNDNYIIQSEAPKSPEPFGRRPRSLAGGADETVVFSVERRK